MAENQLVWESNNVVDRYQHIYLDKPEATILNELKPKLPYIQMLDIGVGGGRTTHFFAPLTKEYVGIDYSDAMVRSCNSKYNDLANASFNVCDARNMAQFPDESFDFILFSYNGIDYVRPEDRPKVLQEMQRVCKVGGMVCFSTHNLQSLEDLFFPQFSLNPLKFYSMMKRYILLRYYNQNWKRYKHAHECELVDPALNFQLTTVYVTPEKQKCQLSDLGFKTLEFSRCLTG